ncbi:MAG: hypothetical protein RLY43_1858, partial [Bacteroidota bacterium]
MNTIIYKIFYSLQKYLALLCGFGYGSYSIKKEFNQSNSFLKKSKNSFLFIDVGGNEGLYAAEIRKKYPKAHIHIFEPAKYNYDYLVAKFKMDNAIHIVKSAISSESCEAVLYMDRLGSGLAS